MNRGDYDRLTVGARLAEVAEVVALCGDQLEAAKNGGVFLDDQKIGAVRSDWVPGPGYESLRADLLVK